MINDSMVGQVLTILELTALLIVPLLFEPVDSGAMTLLKTYKPIIIAVPL